MSSALPEPIDTSHLAPCSRCGTLNGLSARWCWRCDAALTADGPNLPRTVPSVVFDPPFDGDALAMPMPERPELEDDEGVIPRLGRLRSLAFEPTEPPILSEAIEPLSTQPAQPSQPVAPPAEPAPSLRRRHRLVALAGVVLVAVGVVAYVQMHEPRLADLNRLPPPSAGRVAAPAPAPSNAPPVAAIAPPARAPAPVATVIASPAGPAPEVRGPTPSPPSPSSRATKAAVKDSNVAAATPARAAPPRPAPRAPALNRPTPAPLAPARTGATAPSRQPIPALPREAPPIPGPCTANAAALGLCSASSN